MLREHVVKLADPKQFLRFSTRHHARLFPEYPPGSTGFKAFSLGVSEIPLTNSGIIICHFVPAVEALLITDPQTEDCLEWHPSSSGTNVSCLPKEPTPPAESDLRESEA